MLNCGIFADFYDLKMVAATFTQLHAREEKTNKHWFRTFYIK